MESLFDRPVALSIGPQRCGTEWIAGYLRRRGDICLPWDASEIFYFDRHFQRGPEFYASHFKPQPQHKLIMELTTTAFDNPDAPSHVSKLLGADVRLLCPLRHPVERAKAAYFDYLKYGLVRGDIEEAVEAAPQILLASRYADHLARWFTQFGQENVHVVFYETLERDPEAFAKEICTALGIPFALPGGESLWAKFRAAFRKKETASRLDKKDEFWLKSRLDPEVSHLEKIIGRHISI